MEFQLSGLSYNPPSLPEVSTPSPRPNGQGAALPGPGVHCDTDGGDRRGQRDIY